MFAGRKQCGAIQKCPAVKLHVRKLDPLRAQRFRQTNHLRQAIDVAPVNDEIEAKWNASCANKRCSGQLALMRAGARDFVAQLGIVRLKTELHGVEPGLAQFAGPRFVQTDTARDEICVKFCLARAANEFG